MVILESCNNVVVKSVLIWQKWVHFLRLLNLHLFICMVCSHLQFIHRVRTNSGTNVCVHIVNVAHCWNFFLLLSAHSRAQTTHYNYAPFTPSEPCLNHVNQQPVGLSLFSRCILSVSIVRLQFHLISMCKLVWHRRLICQQTLHVPGKQWTSSAQ